MSCVISAPDGGLVEVGVQSPGDKVGSVLCAGFLDEAVQDVLVALREPQRELNAIDPVLATSTRCALEERAASWCRLLGCPESVEVLLDSIEDGGGVIGAWVLVDVLTQAVAQFDIDVDGPVGGPTGGS